MCSNTTATLASGPACRTGSLGITVTLANITTGPSTTDTGYGWLHVLLLFTFLVSFRASVATFLLTVWLDDHWKLHQPYCITFKLRVMFNTRVLSNYLNTDHNTEKSSTNTWTLEVLWRPIDISVAWKYLQPCCWRIQVSGTTFVNFKMVTFDWWIFLKLCRSRGSHNNLRKMCVCFLMLVVFIFSSIWKYFLMKQNNNNNLLAVDYIKLQTTSLDCVIIFKVLPQGEWRILVCSF